MIAAKITSKGQVTIPKKVREKLGVQPGETIGFEEKNGVLIVRKVIVKSPFDKWVGKLTHLKGFILMNTYNDGGAAPKSWSVQLAFDYSILNNQNGDRYPIPPIAGQWVPLRFDIDLDANSVDAYYNNAFLYNSAWYDPSSGGQKAIAAIDLFANNASPVYYDNISLSQSSQVPEPTTMLLLGLGLIGLAGVRRTFKK